ncbi:MAG: hypothetical protein OXU75_15840 [Deltaproteobacteria bacterium]|nr:hypothetical protein [Deltaproteobacteria bacterium]
MRLIRISASVGWLLAGCGVTVSGVSLFFLLSVEVGIALILLGAGALGFAAGLARSAAADRGLVAEVERHIDELRERDRREVEERWLAEGVSPVEQAWSALQRSHGSETAGTPSELDVRLGRMIQDRCDRVWDGIRDRRYVKQERWEIAGLDGRAIFDEIRDVVKEVARLYGKETEKAELDARIGDIAFAARSAIGDLLQAARQAPVVNVTGWTVREVVVWLERVQQVRHLYRMYTPWQHYVRGATLAARIALGANPVTLVASTLAGEALTRVGKHVIQRYAEGWLKELLEGSVALVYLQVARTYDPSRTTRTADWLGLVEALRIHKLVPGIDHNRKLLLDRILRARIPDEFAKLALLRTLADDGEPDPALTPPIDFASLPLAQRQAIAECLGAILRDLRGLNEPNASKAIEEMEKGLSMGLQIDLIDAGSREEIRIEEGFIHLAMLARDWCRLDIGEARQVIEGSAFAVAARKRIGDVGVNRVLLEKAMPIAFDDGGLDSGRVAESEQYSIEPPRDLVGDPLAEPLIASFVDLLAKKAAADWPVEHDHMVLFNASVLLPERKQVTALWSRYLNAVESRLRDRLKYGTLSTVPPGSAPAVLRQIGDQELPAPAGGAVFSDGQNEAVAVFEASSGNARACWVLLFADRVVVGDVPKEDLSLDDGESRTYLKDEVRFSRLSRPLADALVIHCGDDQRLIVDGSVTGTFAGYFGPVLESLGFGDAAPDSAENS